jgi:DNA-binding LytR/AlgR family response regulator
MNHIIFNFRDKMYRIEIAKIVYFEAEGNYSKIVMANKLKALVAISLANIEKALAMQLKEDSMVFIRVGKRLIINRRFIYEVNVSKQCLLLSDFSQFTYQLPVSKVALKSIKEIMTNI